MRGAGRWLATLGIGLLLALDLVLPRTPLGRRGPEARVRSDIPGIQGEVGERLPELSLQDLDGQPLRLEDFRGHPLLLTFERSVDW